MKWLDHDEDKIGSSPCKRSVVACFGGEEVEKREAGSYDRLYSWCCLVARFA